MPKTELDKALDEFRKYSTRVSKGEERIRLVLERQEYDKKQLERARQHVQAEREYARLGGSVGRAVRTSKKDTGKNIGGHTED